MQTERIAIAVRPRAGYEAVDLGFRFARAIFWPLFPAHAIVVVAISGAIFFALSDRLWLAGALVWWLKPLYDRVALAVLSEALFGRVPTLGETLSGVPRLITRTGLLHSLTWLRFSPLRAFTLPVLQLEGLRGIERSKRVKVLVGRDSRAALGLMFACSAFEMVIFLAGLQLGATFRPEGQIGEFWRSVIQGGGTELSWLEAALYSLAICAIEPLYVAGGFALYVNRRVWLEGWDIDLAFRKLEQRAPGRGTRERVTRAASLVLIALALLWPLAAHAEPEADVPGDEAADESAAELPPPNCDTPGPEGAEPCIAAVLEDPEFGTVEKVELWLPKMGEPAPGKPMGWLGRFGLWIGSLGAAFLRVVAWLGLAVVIAALALAILRSLRDRDRGAGARVPADTDVRFGLDLRPESLPVDVVAEARARFASGDASGALSLLYRGALVHLVRGLGLRVPASATEGECERIARGALEAPLASDFALLTRAWVFSAYAHQAPSAETFTELCERWRPRLGGAA